MREMKYKQKSFEGNLVQAEKFWGKCSIIGEVLKEMKYIGAKVLREWSISGDKF